MTLMDLIAARRVLAQQRPYFATILWALKFHKAEGLGTMAVDKNANLLYDPKLTWTRGEIASVLYHEIGHLLRDHSGRAEDMERQHPLDVSDETPHGKAIKRVIDKFQPQIWNIAADCEINFDLEREGVKFPAGTDYAVPRKFKLPDNRTAEFYYETLCARAEQIEYNIVCGSCCGSGEHEEEKDPQVADSQVVNLDDIRREVAKELLSNPGNKNVVDGWINWAKRYYISPSIWKSHLSRTLRRSISYTTGYQDYTYSRPSRRESGEFIMPSMRRPLPHLAVVLDISGSMEGEPTRVALDALDGIFQHTGISGLTLLCTNTRVEQTYGHLRTLSTAKIPYGGGTDMMAGIEAARRLKPVPTTVVVLTDGETPWAKSGPAEFDVVVGLVSQNFDAQQSTFRYNEFPKWARKVEIFYGRE